MKTHFQKLILTGLVLLSFTLAHGQEDSSTQIIFKRQDSLQMELGVRKMTLTGFQANDPCYREGLGSYMLAKDTFGAWSNLTYEEPIKDTSKPKYGKIDGDKNIYWMHGLGGNKSTWIWPAKVTQYGDPNSGFPAFQVNSQNFGTDPKSQAYSEDNSITYAALDMADNARTINVAHTNADFIIAHSQGGIVAREWLRKMEKESNAVENYAHGLVTFGTPHSGARIINLTKPDMENRLEPFIKGACINLNRAILVPKLNEHFITRVLLSDKTVEAIINGSCNLLSNLVIKIALDNFNKRTTYDYFDGAPFLQGYTHPLTNAHVEGLSEYQLKVPVVQFFGVEEEPVFWKYLSSAQNLGEDKLDNQELLFGYNDDTHLQLAVTGYLNSFINNYNVLNEKYNKKTKSFAFVTVKNLDQYLPGDWISMFTDLDLVSENMQAYKGAIDWLKNANDYYKLMVLGSRYVHTNSYSYIIETSSVCQSMTGKNISSYFVKKYKVAPHANFKNTLKTSNYFTMVKDGVEYRCINIERRTLVAERFYVDLPSDGVVLENSARAPIPMKNQTDRIEVKLLNQNHAQMVNSYATKDALLLLYKGHYNSFFKTPQR